MKTRDFVFSALYAALFFVLEWMSSTYFSFLSLPQGGSLEISVLPLIIAGYHLGVKGGLFTAAIALLIRLTLLPIYVIAGANIISLILQVFFDYILAYSIYGCVGFVANQIVRSKKTFVALAVVSLILIIVTVTNINASLQSQLFWALLSLYVFTLVISIYHLLGHQSDGAIVYWGVIVATFIRFMSHNVSGWVFFSSYYEGNLLWGVVSYNAIYMLPNLVLVLIATTFIMPRINKLIKKES